jgi:hypothetical protein
VGLVLVDQDGTIADFERLIEGTVMLLEYSPDVNRS